jgi:DNA-binding CsgD family transcriptional regulator
MSQQDHRTDDSHFSKWMEDRAPVEENLGMERLPMRSRAMDEAATVIARQLNSPLTALLLYMNEIKRQSQQVSQAPGHRVYLQQVVENALQQTERVCAIVKQLSDNHAGTVAAPERDQDEEAPETCSRDSVRLPRMTCAPGSGNKPLTKREREVLGHISEGCSNKQGALRMNISPRTFESHRAEAMRKLGARNTADLVRKALLFSV